MQPETSRIAWESAQRAFASAITDSGQNAHVSKLLHSAPTLSASRRLEIYHASYFSRLEAHLHGVFPMMLRLFGAHEFNQALFLPFISKHSCKDSTLRNLLLGFVSWAESAYQSADKELVCSVLRFELALEDCAYFKEAPVFVPSQYNVDDLQRLNLRLQSHVRLVKCPWNLLSLRSELLRENVGFWLEHPFPKLDKEESHYVVYRERGRLQIDRIEVPEWMFLRLFESGTTIEDAIGDNDMAVQYLLKWASLFCIKAQL